MAMSNSESRELFGGILKQSGPLQVWDSLRSNIL